MVEFAIAGPVFILMVFGIFEFGRAYWINNTLQYSVAQGARYVLLNKPAAINCGNGFSTANLQAYMTTQLLGFTATQQAAVTPSATASWSCGSSPPEMTVTISASYTFSFIAAGLLPYGPITLQQHAVVTTPLS